MKQVRKTNRVLYLVISRNSLKENNNCKIEGTAWNPEEAENIMNDAIENSKLFEIAKKPYFEKDYACSSMNKHIHAFEEIWIQKVPVPRQRNKKIASIKKRAV